MCQATDPSWTALFHSISAVVLEVGGYLTHGSVIAREMNLPCVVGIVKATQKIKTGDIITVDANKGIVEIHKD